LVLSDIFFLRTSKSFVINEKCSATIILMDIRDNILGHTTLCSTKDRPTGGVTSRAQIPGGRIFMKAFAECLTEKYRDTIAVVGAANVLTGCLSMFEC
jgi:hypothetical protein